MSLPPASFDQDVLGLARPTTARRLRDMDVAVGADVRHHPGQRVALPQPLRAYRHARPGSCPAAVRRPHPGDAQAATYPCPKPHGTHHRRASTQSACPTAGTAPRTTTDHRQRRTATLLAAIVRLDVGGVLETVVCLPPNSFVLDR